MAECSSESEKGEPKPPSLLDILDFEGTSTSRGKNEIEKLSDIAKIIENRSVRAKFLLSFMIGLPYSGTTTLLLKLLNRQVKLGGPNSNGLDIYETILFKDSVSGASQLQDITDIDDENDAMLLFSLAKFLTTKHYKISISKEMIEKELCNDTLFCNEEVDTYFRRVCCKLFELMKAIEESHDLRVNVTRSHSFVNFFDLNINKAGYDLAVLLSCTCKYNLVLFNVLGFDYYTAEKLDCPIDLTNEYFGGRYNEQESHLFEVHTALEYFIRNIDEAFSQQRERPNTILVGTCTGLHTNMEIASGKIMERAKKMRVAKALSNGMFYVKKDNNKDYGEVKEKFLEIVDRDKDFEVYVPMKFMFLRCVLHSTKKLFITHEELVDYAGLCRIQREEEVKEFIDLFQKCCSLLVIPNGQHIILQPANFLKGLEKLYNYARVRLNPEDRKQLENGFLTGKLAETFWNVQGSDLYTSVLIEFGLMVKITDDKYFMPDLRFKYYKEMPTKDSNSLIVLYSRSVLPCNKQCEFVATILKLNDSCYKFTLEECLYCNVVKFTCKVKATAGALKIKICFRNDYLELCITDSKCGSESADVFGKVCGLFKGVCIRLLNNMEFRGLQYNFAIVCPFSEGPVPHFLKFHANESSLLEKECTFEGCKFEGTTRYLDQHAARYWVKSHLQNEPPHPINRPAEGSLPPSLKEAAENLCEEASLRYHQELIEKLSEKLGIDSESTRGQDIVFKDTVLNLLSTWYQNNPAATVAELAKKLRDVGFTTTASKLEGIEESNNAED